MKKKKSYTLLVIGAVLLIASIIFTVYAHSTSYAKSVETGTRLSEVKEQISAIEEGTQTGDLDALNAEKTRLSDLKLSQEKPYSYGLTLLFFSILLCA